MLKPILRTIALTVFIAAGGVGTSSAAVILRDGHAERLPPAKAAAGTPPKSRPAPPPRPPAGARPAR